MSASEFRIPFQPASSSQPAENAEQTKLCGCREGDPTNCPNCQVLKSGHLLISSKGIGWTSWKKRWFILTRTSLMFFRSDPNVPPPKGSEPIVTLGGIDLNNSGSVVVKEEKKLLTVLFPDGREGRTFTLKAETTEDLNEWRTALENALAQAPSVAHTMGQNPVFRNGISEPSEDPVEQPNDKSIIGRNVSFALEDPDGSPSFLEKALRFIEEYGVKVEGILRQSADVEEVKRRVWDYENGGKEFSPEEDAHVVGDCIKYVLREMPLAPVPASCCTALVGAFRANRARRLDAMHSVIYEVFPEPNRRLLQRILQMMHNVEYHIAVNRMSLSALAACMAPLLLRPLLAGECELGGEFNMGGDGSLQLLQAAAAANHAQAIVIILLEEYDQIFDDFEEGSYSSDAYTDSEDGDVDKEYSTDNDMPDDDGSHDSGEDDEDVDDNAECSSGDTVSECGGNIGIDALDVKTVKSNISDSASHGNTHTIQPPVEAAGEQSEAGEDIDQISSVSHDPFPSEVAEEDTSQRAISDLSHPTQELCEPNGHAGYSKSSTRSSSSRSLKLLDKSGSSMHKSKRANVLGRTSARKNLSKDENDCSDDEILIEKLEASKSDLQAKIAREVKENAVLQASLEKRKEALQERRFALEKEVEKLREQLQKERNLRASLESGLMNVRRGQVSLPSPVDSKTKADLEEVASAEADIFNLKQKVSDLRGQINSHVLCESCSKRVLNINEPVKDDSSTETSSIVGSNSRAGTVSAIDGVNVERLKKQTTPYLLPSPGKLTFQKQQGSTSSGVKGSVEGSAASMWNFALSQYSNAPLISRPQGFSAASASKMEESGAAPTSALAKLTSRLNFLKERRALLASEMQNLDLGRPSRSADPSPRTDSR